VLGIGVLAVAALLATWGSGGVKDASAQVPAPGLDFSMSIPDVDDCDTADSGSGTCILDPGDEFTVNFYLNSLPETVTEYFSIDLFVTYTGVTSMDNPSFDPWPDCAFPAALPVEGVSVRWGCSYGVDAPASTYTGLVSTLDFACSDDESFDNKINMVHGETDTSMTSAVGPTGQSAEGQGTMDTLTVHCGEPPTPTPEPSDDTPTPEAPTALPPTGDGSGLAGGGDNVGLWIVMVALAVAAGTIGLFGLRSTRSR
jgi:hypothetical protein